MTFNAWTNTQLDNIRSAGQWRSLRSFDALGPPGRLDGQDVVSFASNDYLGLSAHPTVIAAAHRALDRWGTGSTASRLVVGTRPIHTQLEERIADWKGTERALVFPTGFAANLGVLATFGGPDCLVVSDELNHASIIDGCRLSRSKVAVARHTDVAHVDEILDDFDGRAIVITDTVFSMDGDVAPIRHLAEVCLRHGAMLVIDEAHSVFGASLSGDLEVDGLDVLRVLTLSKTLGSLGGAVAGSGPMIDLLVNRARPFIFTTGLTPADAAAAAAAIDIIRSDEGAALEARLRTHVDRLEPGHPSPIVPLIVGEERAAAAAADALLALGLWVPAIRPPTVAPGTARLRVTFSAAHTTDMVSALLDGLAATGLR
jgi:8-amino-7-oxononanoate synthase